MFSGQFLQLSQPIGYQVDTFPASATPPEICMQTPVKETQIEGAKGREGHLGAAVPYYLPVVGESLRHMQIHRHPSGGAQVRMVMRMRVRMWVRMRVRMVVVMGVDGMVHRVVLDMRRSSRSSEPGIGGHRVVAQNGGPWRCHEPTAVMLHS